MDTNKKYHAHTQTQLKWETKKIQRTVPISYGPSYSALTINLQDATIGETR